nr:S26 family signal peptidase [Enterococcus sp.]
FVLGDNRLISKDSRIFGFVDESMIQGEVFMRYWPLNEISLIN